MKSVKRLEIVIDAAHTPKMIEELMKAGAPGYTLVRDVHGGGDRGDRTGDHLTNVFRNSMIVVACPIEQAPTLVEAVRPYLKRYGGICLLSDAEWLRH